VDAPLSTEKLSAILIEEEVTTTTVNKALHTNTTIETIANTAAETSAFGGAITVPAGYLKAGRILRIKGKGVYSTPGFGVDITIRLKMGATTIASAVTTSLLNNADDEAFELEVDVPCHTVGASGLLSVIGYANYSASIGRVFDDISTGASGASIDTTVSHDLDLTLEWDTATTSREVKVLSASVELIN
jgi:hypothetical protein